MNTALDKQLSTHAYRSDFIISLLAGFLWTETGTRIIVVLQQFPINAYAEAFFQKITVLLHIFSPIFAGLLLERNTTDIPPVKFPAVCLCGRILGLILIFSPTGSMPIHPALLRFLCGIILQELYTAVLIVGVLCTPLPASLSTQTAAYYILGSALGTEATSNSIFLSGNVMSTIFSEFSISVMILVCGQDTGGALPHGGGRNRIRKLPNMNELCEGAILLCFAGCTIISSAAEKRLWGHSIIVSGMVCCTLLLSQSVAHSMSFIGFFCCCISAVIQILSTLLSPAAMIIAAGALFLGQALLLGTFFLNREKRAPQFALCGLLLALFRAGVVMIMPKPQYTGSSTEISLITEQYAAICGFSILICAGLQAVCLRIKQRKPLSR